MFSISNVITISITIIITIIITVFLNPTIARDPFQNPDQNYGRPNYHDPPKFGRNRPGRRGGNHYQQQQQQQPPVFGRNRPGRRDGPVSPTRTSPHEHLHKHPGGIGPNKEHVHEVHKKATANQGTTTTKDAVVGLVNLAKKHDEELHTLRGDMGRVHAQITDLDRMIEFKLSKVDGVRNLDQFYNQFEEMKHKYEDTNQRIEHLERGGTMPHSTAIGSNNYGGGGGPDNFELTQLSQRVDRLEGGHGQQNVDQLLDQQGEKINALEQEQNNMRHQFQSELDQLNQMVTTGQQHQQQHQQQQHSPNGNTPNNLDDLLRNYVQKQEMDNDIRDLKADFDTKMGDQERNLEQKLEQKMDADLRQFDWKIKQLESAAANKQQQSQQNQWQQPAGFGGASGQGGGGGVITERDLQTIRSDLTSQKHSLQTLLNDWNAKKPKIAEIDTIKRELNSMGKRQQQSYPTPSSSNSGGVQRHELNQLLKVNSDKLTALGREMETMKRDIKTDKIANKKLLDDHTREINAMKNMASSRNIQQNQNQSPNNAQLEMLLRPLREEVKEVKRQQHANELAFKGQKSENDANKQTMKQISGTLTELQRNFNTKALGTSASANNALADQQKKIYTIEANGKEHERQIKQLQDSQGKTNDEMREFGRKHAEMTRELGNYQRVADQIKDQLSQHQNALYQQKQAAGTNNAMNNFGFGGRGGFGGGGAGSPVDSFELDRRLDSQRQELERAMRTMEGKMAVLGTRLDDLANANANAGTNGANALGRGGGGYGSPTITGAKSYQDLENRMNKFETDFTRTFGLNMQGYNEMERKLEHLGTFERLFGRFEEFQRKFPNFDQMLVDIGKFDVLERKLDQLERNSMAANGNNPTREMELLTKLDTLDTRVGRVESQNNLMGGAQNVQSEMAKIKFEQAEQKARLDRVQGMEDKIKQLQDLEQNSFNTLQKRFHEFDLVGDRIKGVDFQLLQREMNEFNRANAKQRLELMEEKVNKIDDLNLKAARAERLEKEVQAIGGVKLLSERVEKLEKNGGNGGSATSRISNLFGGSSNSNNNGSQKAATEADVYLLQTRVSVLEGVVKRVDELEQMPFQLKALENAQNYQKNKVLALEQFETRATLQLEQDKARVANLEAEMIPLMSVPPKMKALEEGARKQLVRLEQNEALVNQFGQLGNELNRMKSLELALTKFDDIDKFVDAFRLAERKIQALERDGKNRGTRLELLEDWRKTAEQLEREVKVLLQELEHIGGLAGIQSRLKTAENTLATTNAEVVNKNQEKTVAMINNMGKEIIRLRNNMETELANLSASIGQHQTNNNNNNGRTTNMNPSNTQQLNQQQFNMALKTLENRLIDNEVNMKRAFENMKFETDKIADFEKRLTALNSLALTQVPQRLLKLENHMSTVKPFDSQMDAKYRELLAHKHNLDQLPDVIHKVDTLEQKVPDGLRLKFAQVDSLQHALDLLTQRTNKIHAAASLLESHADLAQQLAQLATMDTQLRSLALLPGRVKILEDQLHAVQSLARQLDKVKHLDQLMNQIGQMQMELDTVKLMEPKLNSLETSLQFQKSTVATLSQAMKNLERSTGKMKDLQGLETEILRLRAFEDELNRLGGAGQIMAKISAVQGQIGQLNVNGPPTTTRLQQATNQQSILDAQWKHTIETELASHKLVESKVMEMKPKLDALYSLGINWRTLKPQLDAIEAHQLGSTAPMSGLPTTARLSAGQQKTLNELIHWKGIVETDMVNQKNLVERNMREMKSKLELLSQLNGPTTTRLSAGQQATLNDLVLWKGIVEPKLDILDQLGTPRALKLKLDQLDQLSQYNHRLGTMESDLATLKQLGNPRQIMAKIAAIEAQLGNTAQMSGLPTTTARLSAGQQKTLNELVVWKNTVETDMANQPNLIQRKIMLEIKPKLDLLDQLGTPRTLKLKLDQLDQLPQYNHRLGTVESELATLNQLGNPRQIMAKIAAIEAQLSNSTPMSGLLPTTTRLSAGQQKTLDDLSLWKHTVDMDMREMKPKLDGLYSLGINWRTLKPQLDAIEAQLGNSSQLSGLPTTTRLSSGQQATLNDLVLWKGTVEPKLDLLDQMGTPRTLKLKLDQLDQLPQYNHRLGTLESELATISQLGNPRQIMAKISAIEAQLGNSSAVSRLHAGQQSSVQALEHQLDALKATIANLSAVEQEVREMRPKVNALDMTTLASLRALKPQHFEQLRSLALITQRLETVEREMTALRQIEHKMTLMNPKLERIDKIDLRPLTRLGTMETDLESIKIMLTGVNPANMQRDLVKNGQKLEQLESSITALNLLKHQLERQVQLGSGYEKRLGDLELKNLGGNNSSSLGLLGGNNSNTNAQAAAKIVALEREMREFRLQNLPQRLTQDEAEIQRIDRALKSLEYLVNQLKTDISRNNNNNANNSGNNYSNPWIPPLIKPSRIGDQLKNGINSAINTVNPWGTK